MALVSCVDCKREVSSHASACPNCGCPTHLSVRAVESPPAAPVHAPVEHTGAPLAAAATLNVKLETPLGSATVDAVKAVATLPAWGRLYSTVFALSLLWAAGLGFFGLWAREPGFVVLGIIAPVTLAIVRAWVRWLAHGPAGPSDVPGDQGANMLPAGVAAATEEDGSHVNEYEGALGMYNLRALYEKKLISTEEYLTRKATIRQAALAKGQLPPD